MSIEDRRLFLELTEAGSYAATARRLGLARSTVMRRVEALEAELGVSLVHRAGRALALTEAGHRLAEGLRTVFRSLRRVESEVRSAGGQAAGSLRLWGPMVGVSDELAECLATFQLAHPKVQLRLDLGRDPRAHRPGDFDVMLQMGHRSNPDLQVRNLFRDRLFLVASEAYLAKHGEPASLKALGEHRIIEQRDFSDRVVPWRLADGTRVSTPPPVISTHGVGYVFTFVQKGVGIGRVPASMAESALAEGTLRQVLPEVVVEEPLSMVYLPGPSATTRALLDFMEDYWARAPA